MVVLRKSSTSLDAQRSLAVAARVFCVAIPLLMARDKGLDLILPFVVGFFSICVTSGVGWSGLVDWKRYLTLGLGFLVGKRVRISEGGKFWVGKAVASHLMGIFALWLLVGVGGMDGVWSVLVGRRLEDGKEGVFVEFLLKAVGIAIGGVGAVLIVPHVAPPDALQYLAPEDVVVEGSENASVVDPRFWTAVEVWDEERKEWIVGSYWWSFLGVFVPRLVFVGVVLPVCVETVGRVLLYSFFSQYICSSPFEFQNPSLAVFGRIFLSTTPQTCYARQSPNPSAPLLPIVFSECSLPFDWPAAMLGSVLTAFAIDADAYTFQPLVGTTLGLLFQMGLAGSKSLLVPILAHAITRLTIEAASANEQFPHWGRVNTYF